MTVTKIIELLNEVKEEVHLFVEKNKEDIGEADSEGWLRGFNDGYDRGYKKALNMGNVEDPDVYKLYKDKEMDSALEE